jgi:hypothetical protein
MPNMSYCRFENTYRNLLDCLYAIGDNLSESEHAYRRRLVDVCKEIIDEYELIEVSEMDDDDDEEDDDDFRTYNEAPYGQD